MKTLFIGALAVLISASASADRNQSAQSFEHLGPQSAITVSVSNLTCSTSASAGAFNANSWSWGATNSVTTNGTGGGSAGKPTLTGLTIKKEFDGCSPALFAAVAGGKHLGVLLLSQLDSNGAVVATVKLSGVIATSWNVGSSTKESTPDETVGFAFSIICITNSGASSQCYDLSQGKIA